MSIFNREPALLLGAASAILALGVGFGLDLSPEQQGLIYAALAAILAAVTRQSVYAPATVGKLVESPQLQEEHAPLGDVAQVGGE